MEPDSFLNTLSIIYEVSHRSNAKSIKFDNFFSNFYPHARQ